LLRPAHVIFPRLALLRKLRAADVDISLGSDAHRPQDVGHAFDDAVSLLKQMSFICTTRFNSHKTSHPAIK
jgi:histidinol-phosphatase (PHP family)